MACKGHRISANKCVVLLRNVHVSVSGDYPKMNKYSDLVHQFFHVLQQKLRHKRVQPPIKLRSRNHVNHKVWCDSYLPISKSVRLSYYGTVTGSGVDFTGFVSISRGTCVYVQLPA